MVNFYKYYYKFRNYSIINENFKIKNYKIFYFIILIKKREI